MKQVTFFLVLLVFSLKGSAQGLFSGPININNEVSVGESVISADMDGDGDMDVIFASKSPNKIAWYENDGNGNFVNQIIIEVDTGNVPYYDVYSADFDNDGNMDILSADYYKIAWFQNDGNGNFTIKQDLNNYDFWSGSVFASDLDGDGDQDALSSSFNINILYKYENDGNGNFGEPVIIDTIPDVLDVFATDLDDDGDQDLISASTHKLIWYENDGNGNFPVKNIISTDVYFVTSIFACDLDADGDMDVLSASAYGKKIAWYENDGNGNFGPQNIIFESDSWCTSVFASDLDNDGDMDVLAGTDFIIWFENDGSGNFGDGEIIGTTTSGNSVYACDLDGDHDIDALSAGSIGYKIAWYKNSTYTYSQPLNSEVCLGDTARFTIENATNVLLYQWQILTENGYENLSDEGHYSGTATQTLSIGNVTTDMNNDHFRCVLAYNNSQVETGDAVLTVLPVPETGDITGEPNPEPYKTYTYTVPNPNNSAFDWSVDGGVVIDGTENSKDIVWGEAGYGSLSVVEIDTNGCHGLPVHLAIIIDVEELFAKYNIRVFPNPTSGQIRIDGDDIQKVEILTAGGKPVRRIVPKDKDIEIDMRGNERGIYLIRITLVDKVVCSKFILK